MTRLIVLGASNLTLGIERVFSIARSAWGPNLEVLAALGYGRSYGAPSRILGVRTLPGIVQSGLWTEMHRRAKAPTRGFITDIGIDILYGVSPTQLVAWIEEVVIRLQAQTEDIVLTDLPVATLSRLSNERFLFFRTLFFPWCRLSRDIVVQRSAEVSDGLSKLATARGLRFLRLRPEWYRFDPIHFRLGVWASVWRELLLGDIQEVRGASFSVPEWAEIQARSPERQWLLGKEHVVAQTGLTVQNGGRLWLY